MPIDPENPVARLCASGMEAEGRKDLEEAHRCFLQAWESRTNDYDSAMAAHFVARNQPTLEDGLAWNQRALDHALAAPTEEIREFLPSLYLNLANSQLLAGDPARAMTNLEAGERAATELPAGPYTEVVEDGLRRLRERITAG